MEGVAQQGQTVVLGLDDSIEGLEHEAVGLFVKIELHAQALGTLDGGQGFRAGQGNDHAVVLHIADGAERRQIGDLAGAVLAKETHGAAGFEVMGDFVVLGAVDFNDQPVERIVVAAAGAHGKPAHAALHLAADAHGLRLPAELVALVVVFHAQEFLLPQQGQFAHVVGNG